jgi:GNAT superfamily N-acetyltransferase
MASVYFLENESTHIGLTEVVVHPEERRQGIGTALLARLLPELRARGRTIVEGWQLTFGGDGPKWAEARGFRSVHTMLLQTLEIEEADDALWQVDVPAGYRTQRWIGAAPEELIGSFAQARDAIHDAPIGELAYREPVWTVDSVRAHEAEFRARGVENRVVVAIDESTGEVAGMTELAVKATNPLWGYQRETAVLPSHRGRGLGRCIKAEMIRWLLAERPGFVRIQTTTAAENVHMSRVNLQLGFQTVRTTLGVNAEVDTLESKLAQLDLH